MMKKVAKAIFPLDIFHWKKWRHFYTQQ